MIKELEEIQKFLEVNVSDDINEITERGGQLSVYLARTGKLLADAKKAYNEKSNSSIMETLKTMAKQTPNATSTVVNKLVSSLCSEEKYLVDWCDRLNSGCTHQLDWARTLVSKYKQEMSLQGGIG